MNLLCRQEVIGTCSPESEGVQQPIEIGQASDIHHRRAKRHRRANSGSKHPRGKDDCHTRFSLDNHNFSSIPPFSVELSNPAAMQRMPAIMDFDLLVDMGRMDTP